MGHFIRENRSCHAVDPFQSAQSANHAGIGHFTKLWPCPHYVWPVALDIPSRRLEARIRTHGLPWIGAGIGIGTGGAESL